MSTHRTLAITTFNNKLYKEYAHRFVETFSGIDLRVYSEDILDIKTQHLYYQEQFVKRNSHRTTRNFKYDAVRFCYKPYTVAQALDEYGYEYSRLLWLDADTVFKKPITEAWIDEHLYGPAILSYLGRPNYHSETGLLLFDLRHRLTPDYINTVKSYYDTDNIFLEKEWHDSYIWDRAREQYPETLFHNISANIPKVPGGHIFNYLFADTMDHRKGKRKQLKQSPEKQHK
jgi:hypothetical protein